MTADEIVATLSSCKKEVITEWFKSYSRDTLVKVASLLQKNPFRFPDTIAKNNTRYFISLFNQYLKGDLLIRSKAKVLLLPELDETSKVLLRDGRFGKNEDPDVRVAYRIYIKDENGQYIKTIHCHKKNYKALLGKLLILGCITHAGFYERNAANENFQKVLAA